MRTDDFHYDLPENLIAQTPPESRESSRLLCLNRSGRSISHHFFTEFPHFLRRGDVLVFNNSKVIPARLRGLNAATGGRFEIVLLEENSKNDWWAMVRPGKRARLGTTITLVDRTKGTKTHMTAKILDVNVEGHRRLAFSSTANILDELNSLGETPLPPYIKRPEGPTDKDITRYQTIFAEVPGSVAAPTAGLHFTEGILADLHGRGVQTCHVTLHVGLGTFAPVKAAELTDHHMHEERYFVSPETAALINLAKKEGRRIVAIGTTSLRVLESVAESSGEIRSGPGRTRLFIYPPRDFKIADALLTNFHLPCSTLLMLVSAFASPGKIHGRELVLEAYQEAIRHNYRFFSYGDAMMLF